MLLIKLSITVPEEELVVYTGDMGNVTNLRAFSNYEVGFDGRLWGEVKNYPRWSEPVRALVARGIASTELDQKEDYSDLSKLPSNWKAARVDVGIDPGGRGRSITRLAMARIERTELGVGVGWLEGTLRGHKEIELRPSYADAWDLAQHILCESVFLGDALTEPQPVIATYYTDVGDRCVHMRSSDLPEPLRSAFELRQRYSGKPCGTAYRDAMWIHDYVDFLNGER